MKYRRILIDGKNLLYRAQYGAKALSTEDPEFGPVEIGGVYGFLRSTLALHDRLAAHGAAVIVCWEGTTASGWRRELFPEYKGNRDKDRHNADNPMQIQQTILRRVLSRIGFMQVWSPDFEADDTLATLAAEFSKRDSVAIVTGDRDLHQCVTGKVHVVDAAERWTPENTREKWGILPSQIPDFKAIAGDKSDNTPGVKGVGEKGARELIRAFDSLDRILDVAERIHDGTNPNPSGFPSRGTAKKLVENADAARTFREIAIVHTGAPLVFAPREKDRDAAREVFASLRFASLMQASSLKVVHAIAGL